MVKMVSVRLNDAELELLSRLSEQLGESRTQVVKRSISALVEQKLQRPSPHELAERMGLIGSFRGRANLSENVALYVKNKVRAESARRR